MLPMALARTSKALSRIASLLQPVADYFQSNIHLTTSGYFTQTPLQCAFDVAGIDRIMFSIEYPFSPKTIGRDHLTRRLRAGGSQLCRSVCGWIPLLESCGRSRSAADMPDGLYGL